MQIRMLSQSVFLPQRTGSTAAPALYRHSETARQTAPDTAAGISSVADETDFQPTMMNNLTLTLPQFYCNYSTS